VVQWTGAGQQPVGEPAGTRNQGVFRVLGLFLLKFKLQRWMPWSTGQKLATLDKAPDKNFDPAEKSSEKSKIPRIFDVLTGTHANEQNGRQFGFPGGGFFTRAEKPRSRP
jgi:hypothetical protein